jgi:hypothetical protein
MVWRASDPDPSYFGGVAIRPAGFSREEAAAFETLLQQRRLRPLHLPGVSSAPSYSRLITDPDPSSVSLPYPAILEPATDDRPFFNQRSSLSSLGVRDLIGVFTTDRSGPRATEQRPVAEVILMVVAFETTVAAVLLVGLPLWSVRRRVGSGGIATAVLFGGLGVAYIVVELALLQRFSLFIGHPTVLLSTVLAALLLSSGAGAWWSDRLDRRTRLTGAALTACVAIVAVAAVAPAITGAALGLPLGWRVALTAGMLAPPGFAMGVPFPLLIRRLSRRRSALIPLGWAANGVGSVAGSVVATMVGMSFGFSAALVVGAVLYLLVAIAEGTMPSAG